MAYGFPSSSASKESTCNAGDPSLGRSLGEEIGYPLQYSWASLVAQLVKNPLVMRETWVRSLSWEDPLEKGTDTHSSILPWRIPWTISSMGLQRVGHDWATFTFTFLPKRHMGFTELWKHEYFTFKRDVCHSDSWKTVSCFNLYLSLGYIFSVNIWTVLHNVFCHFSLLTFLLHISSVLPGCLYSFCKCDSCPLSGCQD